MTLYTQMQDGTVTDRKVGYSEPWLRMWRCGTGRRGCSAEPDCHCLCRGPVTDGHDPGDEDRGPQKTSHE